MQSNYFEKGHTYLIRQQGLPATADQAAVPSEVMVIEVLDCATRRPTLVYQHGTYKSLSEVGEVGQQDLLCAVKRSMRKPFLIHPATIEAAVLLKE